MNWSRELKVIFVGEPAEDGGGPRREFFVSAATGDPVLFTGPAENRVPVSSTHALIKKSIFFVCWQPNCGIYSSRAWPLLLSVMDIRLLMLWVGQMQVKDIHCDETRQPMLEACMVHM